MNFFTNYYTERYSAKGVFMLRHWAYDAVFYHIYPLGLCGAPRRNDFSLPPANRLSKISSWIQHMKKLGVNALYMGPIFESTAHGYDTADYYAVDRRLGTNETMRLIADELHSAGIRIILDGVFHHVGRDFWAFRDLLAYRENSAYRDWFTGINFNSHSPYNDPFSYDGWRGHFDLVKLNLKHPHVKLHLLHAVKKWIEDFNIDGLRLDVADCVDMEFLKELSGFTKSIKPDFWLMGEVIHGDYRNWVNSETLDSVTNYECYKGLYSSLADNNYFEIAYSLNRQFGQSGMYADFPLYNFADNHDVNRVASNLKNQAHLYPLYCLLFTMPGVPSIYYGSEWGIEGKIEHGNDQVVRTAIDMATAEGSTKHPGLSDAIGKLATLRKKTDALRYGGYRQLYVSHEQFAFERQFNGHRVIVALNSSDKQVPMDLPVYHNGSVEYKDILNGGTYAADNGRLKLPEVYPNWCRILIAS